jgi:hypothetical protein
MAALPTVPGAHLEVDCGKKTYRLYDPLVKDPDRLDNIRQVLGNANVMSVGDKLKGFEEIKGTMDDDGLVTLIDELRRWQASKSLRMISGDLPSEKACSEHKGRVLNDQWNNSAHKPKYRDQQEDYEKELTQSRG